MNRRLLVSILGAAFAGATLYGSTFRQRITPSARKGSAVTGETYPFTITDPSGPKEVLRTAPRRIVSCALPAEEILPLLIAPSRVVSVTYNADTKGLSNVAGIYPRALLRNHAGLEEILSQEPDLVILTDVADATTVRLLIAAKVPILRFAFYESFAGIADNVRLLAKICGVPDQGEKVVGDMYARIDAVEAKVKDRPRPRTLWYNRSFGGTSGEGTLSDECLAYAGATNVIHETGMQGYVNISQETAIGLLPDVLFVDRWPDGEADIKYFLTNAAWRDVPAIKNKRVYLLDTDICTTGTPYRAAGVEQMARALHPEGFAS